MANNIKILRIIAGKKQKEVSEITGIAQQKISAYESLTSLDNITLGSIRKISEALNVTVNDLIYPLPENKEGEAILDLISERYVRYKEATEKGDVDAIINNRFS